MRLIGITGFKGSGKDTTYECIKSIESKGNGTIDDAFRPTVTRVAFADKLKIMAAKAIGFTNLSTDECIKMMNECKESWDFSIYTGELNGDIKFEFNGRQYLQWFGGEARRVFGDTFWIDQVLPDVPVPSCVSDENTKVAGEYSLMKRYQKTDILCVTDVRYDNEAERIIGLGGEIWKIIKPGQESDGHDSEIPLPSELVDVEIVNSGNIHNLYSLVYKTL